MKTPTACYASTRQLPKHLTGQQQRRPRRNYMMTGVRQLLQRGMFTSVPDLIAAIDEYIAHHNKNPKQFIWTNRARDILQKVIRANSRLSSQNAALN